jgi:hypothetical protein
MNEEMRFARLAQLASESEQALHMLSLGRDAAGAGIDDVVKAQLQPLVRIKGVKGVKVGPAGIEK